MEQLERDLEDLSSMLREELRLEAEEAEREAAVSAAMKRTFRQAAGELMAHGDTIAVDMGGRIFVGAIVGLGTDMLSLEAGAWRTDVALPAVVRLRVMRRARQGGVRGGAGHSPNIRARLMELQLTGQLVEVGMRGAEEPAVGRVAAVGSDHVALGDQLEPEWFLPFQALSFVRIRDPQD